MKKDLPELIYSYRVIAVMHGDGTPLKTSFKQRAIRILQDFQCILLETEMEYRRQELQSLEESVNSLDRDQIYQEVLDVIEH